MADVVEQVCPLQNYTCRVPSMQGWLLQVVRTADSHVAVKLLATLWDLAINVLLLSVNEIQVDFNVS